MDKAFGADARFVSMQIQTVFEGQHTNTYERGLRELKKHGITAIYGFDPGKTGKRSNILQSYHTGGTPWTILIDHTGKVLISRFTSQFKDGELAQAIKAALAAAVKAAEPANEE